MKEITELNRMEVKLPPSVRNVVNYTVEASVLRLICIALKKRYDALPWELSTVVLDILKPSDRYIPPKLTDLLEHYGLEWPSDEEAGERERDERINRRETSNLNEEKMAILNEAVNLGCSWAIEEMERLNGILL